MAQKIKRVLFAEMFMANFFWLIYVIAIVLVVGNMVFMVSKLTDPMTMLLTLLIFIFSIVKLFSSISTPIVIYETEDGKYSERL